MSGGVNRPQVFSERGAYHPIGAPAASPLSGASPTFTLTFSNLSSPVTAAHIHFGQPGVATISEELELHSTILIDKQGRVHSAEATLQIIDPRIPLNLSRSRFLSGNRSPARPIRRDN